MGNTAQETPKHCHECNRQAVNITSHSVVTSAESAECAAPEQQPQHSNSPAGVTHLRSASVVVMAVLSATTSFSCLQEHEHTAGNGLIIQQLC